MSRKKRIISLLLSLMIMSAVIPCIVVLANEAGGFKNFKEKNTFSQNTFTDVSIYDWCYENVASAYRLGLMIGDSETTFNPLGNVTIAEAITVAARLHSIYTSGSDTFESSSPWYQVYVDYALEHNIIEDEYEDYTALASRATYAYILASALPASALEAINTVDDGMILDVAANAKEAEKIYLLYRAGVMIGSDDFGTFFPDSNISRSEIAAVVTRMADPTLRKSITLVNPSLTDDETKPPEDDGDDTSAVPGTQEPDDTTVPEPPNDDDDDTPVVPGTQEPSDETTAPEPPNDDDDDTPVVPDTQEPSDETTAPETDDETDAPSIDENELPGINPFN